jgi:hypothetical protein
MPAQCKNCQKLISADADNRLPPWCPHCGGDIEKNATAAPVTPVPSAPAPAKVALRPSEHLPPPLTWREPEVPDVDGDMALAAARAQDDGSMEGLIDRVQRKQRDQERRRGKNRWAGLGAMAAGLLIVALVFGLNALLGADGSIVIPVKLSLLGLLLTGVGGYTLFSGHDVCNLGCRGLYQISVGPDGVRRTLTAEVGPSALEEGWWHPWEAIAKLVYVEDPQGGPPTLEVHPRSGAVERVRIAETVTAQQLVDLSAAYGQSLQIGTAGDWSRPK